MGSFSRIERKDGDKARLELFGSSDLKNLLFWTRKFDQALIAFLDCTLELGNHIETLQPSFHLPYRINKDRIGELGITRSGGDAEWTRALKYLVIDLKWVMTFAASMQNE